MKSHFIIGRKFQTNYKYLDYRNDYTIDDPLKAAQFPSIEDIRKYFPDGISGEVFLVETNISSVIV